MGNLIRNDNKWDGEDGSYRTFSIRWMNALKTISPFLVHIVTGEVSYPDAYDNMGGPPNEEMDHLRMEFCRLSSLLASLLANSCPSDIMTELLDECEDDVLTYMRCSKNCNVTIIVPTTRC